MLAVSILWHSKDRNSLVQCWFFSFKQEQTLRQTLYKPLGVICLSLGVAGIVLPVLPTTPFVLLAAWFFARSSEQWHQRLLASELFGPIIRNWEQHRCISLRTKCVGIGSMLVAGSASIVFALSSPWAQIGTAALMLTGAAVLLSIKTCPTAQKPAVSDEPPQ